MGAPLRVRLKPLSDSLIRPAAFSFFNFIPESPFNDLPRVLVSGVFANAPGTLVSFLVGVGQEFTTEFVDEDIGREVVTFGLSIDGLVAARVEGAFTVSAILRVVEASPPTTLRRLQKDMPEVFTDSIRRAIETSSGLRQATIRVDPFERYAPALFDFRRFTEYRFGVSLERDNWKSLLTQACQAFSARLGAFGTPIAYLYFPSGGEFEPRLNDGVWACFGVGLPPSLADSVSHDLAANDIARSTGLSLTKHDATEPEVMARRFKNVRDSAAESAPVGSTVPSDTPDQEEQASNDIVIAYGPAKAGFVAEMLGRLRASNVVAGSMAVLGGYTVASWAVAAGSGPEVEETLRDIRHPGRGGDLVSVDAFSTAIRPDLLATNLECYGSPSFWIHWEAPDFPGVMEVVFVGLAETIGELFPASAPPDFSYTISRVLRLDEIAAGKGRFYLDLPTSSHLDSESLDLLGSRVQARLEEHISPYCERLATDPLDVRVFVANCESTEQPWAELAFA